MTRLTDREWQARFDEIAATHDNRDSVIERVAIRADREGRAAYVCTATYHNQTAGLAAWDANHIGAAASIAKWSDESYPGKDAATLIGHLYPLNAAA